MAREIIERAQKVAQDTRDADIAATREELERMRVRAAADIESEKARALQDLRAQGKTRFIGFSGVGEPAARAPRKSRS